MKWLENATKRLHEFNEKTQQEAEGTKAESMKEKIFNGIGLIIGGAFGYYTGLKLIIPFAFAFLCGWVANKFIKSSLSKYVIPAFAVQMGQALFILMATIVDGFTTPLLFEESIFIVILLWMLLRPNLFPIIVMPPL